MLRAILLATLALVASGCMIPPFPPPPFLRSDKSGIKVHKIGLQPKIVGGKEATPNSYPWQVSLQKSKHHICGGTIVDEYHIVCAAHCVNSRQHYTVIAGAHNIGSNSGEETQQSIKVSKIWRHEAYNPRTIVNDVSVLKLAKPLAFNNNVMPIKMAESGVEPKPGTVCINSGWGSTSNSSKPNMPKKLQFVELPIVERSTCESNYNGINVVAPSMICAGKQEGGVSPCSGDSGGPLVCPDANGNNTLTGIVSWGRIPCGKPKYPGVFANVANLREWIDKHVAM